MQMLAPTVELYVTPLSSCCALDGGVMAGEQKRANVLHEVGST